MPKTASFALGILAVVAWGATGKAGEGAQPAPAGEGRAVTIVQPSARAESAAPEAKIPVADFRGDSLKVVLDLLSTKSGINIRCLDDKVAETKVTFCLESVTWREVLSFLADKYGLIVDDSREAAGLIVVKAPPKVSINFDKPTEIREVISTIAFQSGANLIVGPEVKGPVSLSIKDVPWEEALDMVVRTLNFVAVKEKFNTYRITTPDRLAQQLETRIFRLSYIQPEGARYVATISSEFVTKEGSSGAASSTGGAAGPEPVSLLAVLRGMASQGGKINYVRDSNTLVITDTTTKLDAMQKLIEKLDVAPRQVHLTVRMTELTDTESEALGMEWARGFTGTLSGSTWETAFPLIRTMSKPRFIWGGIQTPVGQPSVDGSPAFGTLDFANMSAVLRFLKTKTKASLIQAPSITALDNHEATIHVGKVIRYAEASTQTSSGGSTTTFSEAANSPVKEGVQLLVVPHVTGPDCNVLMTVVVKTERLDPSTNTDSDGFRRFGDLLLPQTTQQIVVTKELLRDSETSVIGGLKRETGAESQTKVPYLADIPILGWLFKVQTTSAERRNLMVFVTPTVIDFQKEDRMARIAREIQRDLTGPFFGYEEKGPEAAPAAGGSGGR